MGTRIRRLSVATLVSSMVVAGVACFPDYRFGASGGADASPDSAGPGLEGSIEAAPGQDSAADTGTSDAAGGSEAAVDSGPKSGTDSGTDSGVVEAGSRFLAGPIGPSNHAITSTAHAATAVGDLVLICVYVEPAGESTTSAVYGPFTPPSNFTLAAWAPIASNDANITTAHTSRQYLWWGYATVAGAQPYTIGGSTAGFYYADTAIITVKGATAGSPFADTPSTASYADGANVSAFPSVSVTPASAGTGFLWVATSWTMGLFGYPAGYADLVHANTLSIGSFEQGAPATQTVAPAVSPTNLLTSALMTFR